MGVQRNANSRPMEFGVPARGSSRPASVVQTVADTEDPMLVREAEVELWYEPEAPVQPERGAARYPIAERHAVA